MNAQGKREKWKPQQYVEHIKKIMSDLDAHRLVPDLRGTLGMPVGTCIAEGRLDDSRKQREFQSFGSNRSAEIDEAWRCLQDHADKVGMVLVRLLQYFTFTATAVFVRVGTVERLTESVAFWAFPAPRAFSAFLVLIGSTV